MVVHSQTIGYLLNSLTDLEAIRVRAERIAALQQAYFAAVPRELAQSSTVGYETQGTLVLLADSGAVAARLRQLTPRLLLTIRKQFPEVRAIRIEVQLVRGSRRPPAPIRRVGATGLRSLTELEAGLADGPLRDALRRLIRREAGQDRAQPRTQHGDQRIGRAQIAMISRSSTRNAATISATARAAANTCHAQRSQRRSLVNTYMPTAAAMTIRTRKPTTRSATAVMA